jgi:hypothetical protein
MCCGNPARYRKCANSRLPDYVIRTFCLRLWHATQLLACRPRFLFFVNKPSSTLFASLSQRISIMLMISDDTGDLADGYLYQSPANACLGLNAASASFAAYLAHFGRARYLPASDN